MRMLGVAKMPSQFYQNLLENWVTSRHLLDPPWWYGQKKPHKISTHLAFSENCYFHLFYRLSDWVEILWGFMKFNFKLNLKVSAFYLEKQKSFVTKKNIFLAIPPRWIPEMALGDSIFQKVLVSIWKIVILGVLKK